MSFMRVSKFLAFRISGRGKLHAKFDVSSFPSFCWCVKEISCFFWVIKFYQHFMSFSWSSGCYTDNLLIFWNIYEFFKGFSLYHFLLCFCFFSAVVPLQILNQSLHWDDTLSECTDFDLTFQQVLKKAIKKSNILWLTLTQSSPQVKFK